jgi:hypothetical protein
MVTPQAEEHTDMTTVPASLFKIWNKTLGRYDDPMEYALRCDGYALAYDWHNDHARTWGAVFNEYAIQLFSGLFDIAGNPIYGGDYLVDPSEKEHDLYFIYEVGLYNGSYRKPYIYKAFVDSDEVHVVGRVNNDDALDFSKLRIKGSIHETPLNIYR